MVVALGPGKFYGSSLPRPRFYTDVKFNEERVDPPPSVTDPLMAWAEEAHWSMGGLNVKRHRLQGRIEGNVESLRVQREQIFKRSPIPNKSVKKPAASRRQEDEIDKTPSPPRAPVAIKRRRVVGLLDEDEEEEVVAAKRGRGGGRLGLRWWLPRWWKIGAAVVEDWGCGGGCRGGGRERGKRRNW
ncbi:uncharacterized protein LOC131021106 [Salvia miltiorrhiza]|uniref:uncharacterized protein LOC131021106 n=1 Tax=Salvia miltiorrhiza TaxID=226208 RepID=UPI0025ABEAD6|nr:uncharacterized protein LOC131021106 [Salvia miltiorrhiza]